MLGMEENYTHFDADIVMHINSVFMTLHQIGIGPASGFFIVDKSKTWADYISSLDNVEAVKVYIYLKVRLVFDPPSNSAVIDAMERSIKETEWRLNAQAERNLIVDVDNTELQQSESFWFDPL